MIRAKLLLCGVGFAIAASSAPASVAKTVVGVINWDCSLPSETWFGHFATTALSPAAFRHATPYYADVKGPDRIDYRWRTVEEYEREMQYAIDAGIDYFAYCWYGEQKEKGEASVAEGVTAVCDSHIWELATARQLHAKSRLRDRLGMCAILVVLHPLADAELESLARTMKEGWYQKIGDRPLLYLYGGKGEGVLTRLRRICREVGAADPYVAVMGDRRLPAEGLEGVQALSDYSVSVAGEGSTYARIVAKAVGGAERRAGTGMPVIPNFSVGWDPSPRNVNPVPWCKYRPGPYAPFATEEELLAGAKTLADWIMAHRGSCPTGHILTFAWNEFEEGGWICPTWRADGRPDTARLQAFRKVADFWRKTLDGGPLP